VSHDVQETARIADYIYIISNGQVIGEGPPQVLLKELSPLVRQFVDGQPDGPLSFDYPAIDIRKELLQ
jgi:phospholipid/cholesterol/gamma-HCH transport system ATP-binding protein